jgi:hypothetical protein
LLLLFDVRRRRDDAVALLGVIVLLLPTSSDAALDKRILLSAAFLSSTSLSPFFVDGVSRFFFTTGRGVVNSAIVGSAIGCIIEEEAAVELLVAVVL